MFRDRFKIGEGVIEVDVIDNIIYVKIFHVNNDEIAMGTIDYVDKIIDRIPGSSIRIWDFSELPSKSFMVTNDCIKRIIAWSEGIKRKRPGSKAYFIAPEPLLFGMARMYQIQASDERMDVIVLRNIDELPTEIREKIR